MTHSEQAFAKMIQDAVFVSKHTRLEHKKHAADTQAIQFAYEFMTTQIGVARRSGKTRFIASTMLSYRDVPMFKDNALMITYNETSKLDAMNQYGLTDREVATMQQVIRHQYAEQKYEKIYVDEPTICFRGVSKQEFYSIMIDSNRLLFQDFIFIGTF